MYKTLFDINTNPRRSVVVASGLSTKSNSPAALSKMDSDRHRNMLYTGAPSSPRYSAPSPSPKVNMSPAAGSRIPRKVTKLTSVSRPAQTMGGSTPQRIEPPKAHRENTKYTNAKNTRVQSEKPKGSPLANCDKPLPSPPVAQIVNPSSPPKAQRTLVDAEVVGTPTSEQWPILSPEPISPQVETPSPGQVSLKSKSSNSASHSGPKQNDNVHGIAEISLGTASRKNKSESSVGLPISSSVLHGSPQNSTPAGSLHDLSITTPSLGLVHAITTAHDEALDSPLARKPVVPLRISSKRSSLPPMATASASTSTTPPSTPQLRQARPGSTKWPILDIDKSQPLASRVMPLPLKSNEARKQPDQSLCTKPDSVGSESTWSMTTEPAPETTSNRGYCSVRVKRLSDHANGSGLGPVLTISDDADSVLLGNDRPASEAPARPSAIFEAVHQKRPLSVLSGQTSRQSLSSTCARWDSKSSSPPLPEAKTDNTLLNSAYPARTIYSVRRGNMTAEEKSSSSVVTRLPWNYQNALRGTNHFRESSYNSQRGASGASQSTASKNFVNASEQSPYKQTPNSISNKDEMTGETQLLDEASLRLSNIRSANLTSPDPILSKNLEVSRNSFRESFSDIKVNNDHDEATHPLKRGNSTNASLQSSPATSAHIAGCRQNASNNLATCSSTEEGAAHEEPKSESLPSKVKDEVRQQSKLSTESSIASKDTKKFRAKNSERLAEVVTKVKAKRSFRDFFHRREGKLAIEAPTMPKSTKELEHKRSSLTMAGSTLAKRLRNSANYSKGTSPRATEINRVIHSESKASQSNSQAQNITAHEDTLLNLAKENTPATCSDTATIVKRIVSRVTALPSDSPDRLRGLEIAEAVLNSVDAYKQAKISAIEAKKHARQAELNAQRAGVELARLQKLCEPSLDSETVHNVKKLIRQAGLVQFEEHSSPSTIPLAAVDAV